MPIAFLRKLPLSEVFNQGIRFFLCLLVFWLPYSKAVIEASIILALICWVAKRWVLLVEAKKKLTLSELAQALKPTRSCLNDLIFLFLLAGFISALLSPISAQSLSGFVRKTLEWFVIFFLTIEAFTTKKHLVLVLWIFLMTSLAVVADGFIQFYIWKKDVFFGFPVTDGRVTASFEHANNLGGYLLFLIPVLMGLLFFKINKLFKFFLGVFLALSIWLLVITFSRGAWIGLVMGVTLFSILFLFSSKMKTWLLSLILVVLIALGFFLVSPYKFVPGLENRSMEGTANWRWTLWLDSLRMTQSRPCFGFGPNTFMSVFKNFGQELRGKAYYHNPTYAHNCFIQILCEYGFFGFLIFIWLWAQFFVMVLQNLKEMIVVDPRWRIMKISLISGTLAFLLHSTVDTHFYSIQLVALIWFIVGIQVTMAGVSDDVHQQPLKELYA